MRGEIVQHINVYGLLYSMRLLYTSSFKNSVSLTGGREAEPDLATFSSTVRKPTFDINLE